jgi:hypothetical protein
VSASPSVGQTAVQAAQDAAGAWASWRSSDDGNGHFVVQQGGGGTVTGQTKLSYDRQGFIKGATVQIS